MRRKRPPMNPRDLAVVVFLAAVCWLAVIGAGRVLHVIAQWVQQ